MSKWLQDKETFSRDGRAIQGTVPIVRMDDADGCAYAAVVSVGASEERVKAIAALITSAPDLLEALESIVESFKYLAKETECGDHIAEDAACLRLAYAAIKSAKP